METISSFEDMGKNAYTYMNAIMNPATMEPDVRHTMLKTLTTSRRWFAFEDPDCEFGGGYLVVPAKFAGYADMTPELYEANRKSDMHGGYAERACLKAVTGSYEPALLAVIHELASLRGNGWAHSNSTVFLVTPPYAIPLSGADRAKVDSVLSIIGHMDFEDRRAAIEELVAAL